LIEYERTIFNRRYPQAERERLLHYVSTYVRHALPQPVEVEALAMQYQMSRSAFSHHFKTITGLSPAQFMTRIRLEEAVSQLLQTPQRLEDIALATGFASATHFCKVFRRHYQMSPGMFRQQMKHS
jgi:transcriptional regulator GlxA family with amidase domain